MEPMKVRVGQIIDFGSIVSLVGWDIEANRPVTIHVDHRPFRDFLEAWRTAGLSEPIAFAAQNLTLSIGIEGLANSGVVDETRVT